MFQSKHRKFALFLFRKTVISSLDRRQAPMIPDPKYVEDTSFCFQRLTKSIFPSKISKLCIEMCDTFALRSAAPVHYGPLRDVTRTYKAFCLTQQP